MSPETIHLRLRELPDRYPVPNFMIGGKSLLEESGQEVLEFIGKRRYYQKKFVDNGISIIPTFVKEYRLGLHVPGSKKFKIIIVKQ